MKPNIQCRTHSVFWLYRNYVLCFRLHVISLNGYLCREIGLSRSCNGWLQWCTVTWQRSSYVTGMWRGKHLRTPASAAEVTCLWRQPDAVGIEVWSRWRRHWRKWRGRSQAVIWIYVRSAAFNYVANVSIVDARLLHVKHNVDRHVGRNDSWIWIWNYLSRHARGLWITGMDCQETLSMLYRSTVSTRLWRTDGRTDRRNLS